MNDRDSNAIPGAACDATCLEDRHLLGKRGNLSIHDGRQLQLAERTGVGIIEREGVTPPVFAPAGGLAQARKVPSSGGWVSRATRASTATRTADLPAKCGFIPMASPLGFTWSHNCSPLGGADRRYWPPLTGIVSALSATLLASRAQAVQGLWRPGPETDTRGAQNATGLQDTRRGFRLYLARSRYC